MTTSSNERIPPSESATPAQQSPRLGWLRQLSLRVDWPVALCVAILAALLLWLALLPVTQRTIRLAEAPAWVALAGFYGPEDNGAFSYRWSQPEARLTLPAPPARSYTVALRVQDGPGSAAARRLVVGVNGTPLATLYPDSTLREYRIAYSRPASGAAHDGPLTVDLTTDPRVAPGDARELGFVVESVRWEVAAPPPLWRAGLLLAQLALLGLAYGIYRALPGGRRTTLALIAYAVAATLLWLATSIHPAMIVALAALGLLFAVRRAPTPSLAPLAGSATQRWLFAVATLAVWASTPLLIDPDSPGNWPRGYVAILLAGLATVGWLYERRPTIALGGYVLATALAAAWWHRLIAPALAAIPGLQPYDQVALRLVPWVLVLCAVAGCALARLLPATHGRGLLAADLLAGIVAVALPAAVWLTGRADYSELERTLRVSWVGALLVLLVATKACGFGALLWRAAPGATTERRVALAVLALFAAVYWSIAPWRMAAMGLSGDESGYLTAALTLARDRDLELTNNGYSPWMLARVQYPNDAWGHEYPDNAQDRFAAGSAYPLAQRHDLPIVAGPGIQGQIGVVNTATTPTEVTLHNTNDLGTTGVAERFTLAPSASRLIAIPAENEWRGAMVEATAPIGVAVRLVAASGAIDAYGAAPPASRFCLPVPNLPAAEALIFLRNTGGTPVTLTADRFSATGQPLASESPRILADGTLRLALPAEAAAQTLCVASERPLVAVGLIQVAGSGLLALPALTPTQTPLALPPAPTTTHLRGNVALIVHNPGDRPLQVRRPSGEAPPLADVPPHGTAQIALETPADAGPSTTAYLETNGPYAAYFLPTLDRHRAILAPAAGGTVLWLPAIVAEDRRFVATHVALENPGAAALPVTVSLLDDGGRVRDERRLTLCGNCTARERLDFTDADGSLVAANGVIRVTAEREVRATVAQITTQSGGFQHEWGLAVLLVPGVLLGEALGALLTAAGIGALLVAQLYGLLRDGGIERRVAKATVLALGLAPPLLPFAFLLYPEIAASLLLVTGLRLALAASLRGWRLTAAILCPLAIPLLHTRLLPLAAALAACLVWRVVGRSSLIGRLRPIILLALGAPIGLVALWWLASPLLPPPLALSARLSATTLGGYFSTERIGHYLAGIAFDRATGLLPVAPLLFLAPIGLLALWRQAPRYAIWPGLLFGLQFGLLGLRAEGWEAWGPPGRYILPVVPLLGLGVASAWSAWSPRWLRYLGAALAFWGWLIAAFVTWVPHAAYYFVPERKWFGDLLLRSWGWPNPLRLFPFIAANQPFAPQGVLPWLLLLALLTAVGVRWRALVAPRAAPDATG